MQTAIATTNHATEWAAVLDDAQVVTADTGQGSGALATAARLPVDTLILDVDTGPGLAPAVVRYRLARPGTRIILMAVGHAPGDAEVAAITSAGVYDICTEPSNLPTMLASTPATLSDAVDWLPRGLQPQAAEPKVVTRTVERIVERERIVHAPMATHPVVLGLVSLVPGSGTTTAIGCLAGYLAHRGHAVLIAELVSALHQAAYPLLQDYLPRGVDAVAGSAEVILEATALRRWPYILLDVGTCDINGGQEPAWPLRPDRTVVVLPAAVWRGAAPLKQFAEAGGRADVWLVSGAAPGPYSIDQYIDAIAAVLGSAGGNDDAGIVRLPDVTPYRKYWPAGYRFRDKHLRGACEAVLGGLLPEGGKRR